LHVEDVAEERTTLKRRDAQHVAMAHQQQCEDIHGKPKIFSEKECAEKESSC
jgi:hypothetical protein